MRLAGLALLLVLAAGLRVCAGSAPKPAEGGDPSDAPSAGALSFSIELGVEEEVPGGGDIASAPDGHVSVLWAGGQMRMWLAGEVRTYLLQGPSLDALAPYQRAGGSDPTPVLVPSGTGFDSDYAAFGSVLPDPRTGELIGFFHAEQCDRDNYTASIGAARSGDGGVSWQRTGAVITGRRSTDSCDKSSPRGAGQPSVAHVGDYLYLYYTDWGGDIPDQIHLARAPISSATEPGAWSKYYQGSFSEPGLGGDSTPVIRRPEPVDQGVYAANASVSYNTYLHRYLAVFDASNGFWTTSSADGITWDQPVRLPVQFPQSSAATSRGTTWFGYASLISASELSHLYTSQSGYLYYGRGVRDVTPHRLMRRPFTIQLGSGGEGLTTPAAAPQTSVELRPEEQIHLPGGGTWICSGDLEIRRANSAGDPAPLYDSDAATGLVVGAEAAGRTEVVAPYGASCEVADPLGPTVTDLLDERANDLLTSGCLVRCSRVHVLEIEPDASTARESRWLP
ncbi:MAG: hypothetical protein ACRDJ9_00520 [Dehalococcoidia bacterium]